MERILAAVTVVMLLAQCSTIHKYDSIAFPWEADMLRFDSLNKVHNYSDQSVLFVGSSSIRLWDNIVEDMAPYEVIQRGYGGASYADLAYHIERIVYPLDFESLVVFAGNDVWGKPTDRSPGEIKNLLNHIIKRVENKFGSIPIFVVEVTHVPMREHQVHQVDAENKALQAVCEKYDHVYWIPTKQIYLMPDGKVNRALFREDNIHQNAEGYRLWTELIKGHIKSVLGESHGGK